MVPRDSISLQELGVRRMVRAPSGHEETAGEQKKEETNPFGSASSISLCKAFRNLLTSVGINPAGIRFSDFLSHHSYIIPPSFTAGAAGVGSGISTIPHSVVRNIPATEAAFSRATRLTFVGSMTPASNIFIYSPVRAL